VVITTCGTFMNGRPSPLLRAPRPRRSGLKVLLGDGVGEFQPAAFGHGHRCIRRRFKMGSEEVARHAGKFWDLRLREPIRASIALFGREVSVEDHDVDYDDDLGFVRHQLDDLAYWRATCGLRPTDVLRYQELCEKEKTLLAAHRFALAG